MPAPPRTSFLFDRWPRRAARHPWRVIGAAVAVLAALVFLSSAFGGQYEDAFSINGTESQAAVDVLRARFPQAAGDTTTVVVHTPGGINDAATRARVDALVADLRALPHVAEVTSPYEEQFAISPDGTIARIDVEHTKKARDLPRSSITALTALRKSSNAPPEFQVEVGGPTIQRLEHAAGFGRTELIGISAAIVVLLLAFGSVVAMGLPIVTALLALGMGMLIVSVGARFVPVPSQTGQFGSMIGLGVGIDYALLIVTRFREGLARKLSIEDAIAQASATAGRSVLFAGVTVVIAMLGLWAVGIQFVAALGTAAAIVVSLAVLIALLVMPAILSLIGRRIDRWRVPLLPTVSHESESGMGYRWSRVIQRAPVPALFVSLAVLLTLAVPLLSIQIGSSDAGNNPEKFTSRRAYDLLSQGFGPGFNGPILVALRIDDAPGVQTVEALPGKLEQMPGIMKVTEPRFNADQSAATMMVIPATAPQEQATADLVHDLRRITTEETQGGGATAFVGGSTASFIDIADKIMERLPWLFASVIGLSFLLLMAVFRSVLVPLKAAVMNLLAIGAAYGVVVAVFQWGWFAGPLGVAKTGPIESFLPMFLFAVLFGLSMDYEVFLVSRIREEYLRSGDSTLAVARGLSVTTRLITAAAAIMVAVFLSFALGDERVIKEFGIGLATAIFIDATIVRLVLVPALMQLMGDANWWFPSWLDRLVPRISVEGPPAALEPAPVEAARRS